jgi:hypothetical protein
MMTSIDLYQQAPHSYPHPPVPQPDAANPIYCGDIVTNLGCFNPVVVPLRCREPWGKMQKSDKHKMLTKIQTTAADLSPEQDRQRIKYQQFWYVHDFKDSGTALHDRNRVVRFPPVC